MPNEAEVKVSRNPPISCKTIVHGGYSSQCISWNVLSGFDVVAHRCIEVACTLLRVGKVPELLEFDSHGRRISL